MDYNILICDDEEDIVSAITIYLETEGYNVFAAYNGYEALEIIDKEQIHLVILDLMMPELDGVSTIIKIREKSNMPIIILSAKSEVTDKIIGLNLGADDYITKPFNAVELVARVSSGLRRYLSLGSGNIDKDIYTVGRIKINDRSKEVYVGDEIVSLTPYEYKILLLLVKEKGKVIPSDEIYERVWQEEAHDIKRIVSVHISHLRDKIEINSRKPDIIKSVYGMGYKVDA